MTKISEVPSLKIRFDYETFNTDGDVLNSAYTTLVFVDVNTGKPTKAPPSFLENLSKVFKA